MKRCPRCYEQVPDVVACVRKHDEDYASMMDAGQQVGEAAMCFAPGVLEFLKTRVGKTMGTEPFRIELNIKPGAEPVLTSMQVCRLEEVPAISQAPPA